MDWQKLKFKMLVLLTPSCWVRTHSTDPEWDKKLWDLLATTQIEFIGSHEILIGGEEVWFRNHPYASGTRGYPTEDNAYSSRSTALYLHSLLPAARIMQSLKGINGEPASNYFLIGGKLMRLGPPLVL